MINKVSIILGGLLLGSFPTHAATFNAASTSFTDVSTAVSHAVTGDTVVIPAGTIIGTLLSM